MGLNLRLISKSIIGFGVSFLLVGACQTQSPKIPERDIDLSTKVNTPKHYIVGKTNFDLEIDGIANEEAWDKANFTEPFVDIEGLKTPQYRTQVKMLWDDQFLYVYAELEEPHVWGNIKKRDSVIYWNNDFEVFLDPSRDGRTYGEIEINALGTVWDLFLDKPYRVGGKANFHWNLNQLQSAVHIEGSLNDPGDIDSLWTVEMAIPLKPLIELKNRPKSLPKEGEQWSINFSRVQWEHELIDEAYKKKRKDGKLLRESNWVWTPQLTINMHQPEHWGTLQFTEKESWKEVEYNADEQLMVKQCLYALFRETNFGSLKDLKETDFGHREILNLQYSDTGSYQAHFNKTKLGYEFEINKPLDSSSYLINQEGLLRKIK